MVPIGIDILSLADRTSALAATSFDYTNQAYGEAHILYLPSKQYGISTITNYCRTQVKKYNTSIVVQCGNLLLIFLCFSSKAL